MNGNSPIKILLLRIFKCFIYLFLFIYLFIKNFFFLISSRCSLGKEELRTGAGFAWIASPQSRERFQEERIKGSRGMGIVPSKFYY